MTSAIQEDAQVVGLSILSSAHLDYCTRLARRLQEEGASDVVLLLGGTIPEADRPALEELGYHVFPIGSRLAEIVSFVRGEVPLRHG